MPTRRRELTTPLDPLAQTDTVGVHDATDYLRILGLPIRDELTGPVDSVTEMEREREIRASVSPFAEHLQVRRFAELNGTVDAVHRIDNIPIQELRMHNHNPFPNNRTMSMTELLEQKILRLENRITILETGTINNTRVSPELLDQIVDAVYNKITEEKISDIYDSLLNKKD